MLIFHGFNNFYVAARLLGSCIFLNKFRNQSFVLLFLSVGIIIPTTAIFMIELIPKIMGQHIKPSNLIFA